MADKIKQRKKDKAIELDATLKSRKSYIEVGTFIEDEKIKIHNFLASPYLGSQMRGHLSNIKTELENNPNARKAREIDQINRRIVENDKILAKEVE